MIMGLCCDVHHVRPGPPGKVARCLMITVVWLSLFLLLSYLIDPFTNVPRTRSKQMQQNLRVLSKRLSLAFRELNRLKNQNEALKLVIKAGLSQKNETIVNMFHKKSKKRVMSIEGSSTGTNCKSQAPSVEYEQTRRTVERTVHELWYFLRAKSENILAHLDDGAKSGREASQKAARDEVKSVIMNSVGYTQFLLKNIQHLANVDGFKAWRMADAKKISKTVQRRFNIVQNPPNCWAGRTLHCELNTTCGLACRLVRAAECFAESYRLQRTLVIEDNLWEENFQPLSTLCSDFGRNEDERSTTTVPWPGSETDLRLRLPAGAQVAVSSAVPSDMSTHLNKLRGDPLLWWRSQLFSYLMRPLPSVRRLYQTAGEQIHFKKPIIGVCIDDERKLNDLVSAVENYYQQMELTAIQLKRRIYVSSANELMAKLIKKTYPHFEVVSASSDVIDVVNDSSSEFTDFHRELLDVHFLSKSDFIVSAKSPRLCRVAFALMQAKEDAHNKICSVGVVGPDHRRPLDHLAIVKHVAQNERELDLALGEIVVDVENLANGFSEGIGKRSRKRGIFPSYKVTTLTMYHAFSKYKDDLAAEDEALRIRNMPIAEEVYEYED